MVAGCIDTQDYPGPLTLSFGWLILCLPPPSYTAIYSTKHVHLYTMFTVQCANIDCRYNHTICVIDNVHQCTVTQFLTLLPYHVQLCQNVLTIVHCTALHYTALQCSAVQSNRMGISLIYGNWLRICIYLSFNRYKFMHMHILMLFS